MKKHKHVIRSDHLFFWSLLFLFYLVHNLSTMKTLNQYGSINNPIQLFPTARRALRSGCTVIPIAIKIASNSCVARQSRCLLVRDCGCVRHSIPASLLASLFNSTVNSRGNRWILHKQSSSSRQHNSTQLL